jgi:hypothetical protein
MSGHVQLPNHYARKLMLESMQNLARYPIKSAEAYRNALLGKGALGVNPLLTIDSDAELNWLKHQLLTTVAEGRMIDFGYIPNAILKHESVRSRLAFEMGEFLHPYATWFGVSRWEGGCNGYFVSPHPQWPGQILVIETYGVSLPDLMDVVLIYDIISIETAINDTVVRPYPMKHQDNETDEQRRLRGSNSLDPLVVMLSLLHDASVPIHPIDAPHKLNKKRAQQGKVPIPSHTLVDTRDYVAHFASRTTHSSARHQRGGTHASPVAHWRRAHMRTLEDGRLVPVRSSKVNWRDTEELHRLFYRLR